MSLITSYFKPKAVPDDAANDAVQHGSRSPGAAAAAADVSSTGVTAEESSVHDSCSDHVGSGVEDDITEWSQDEDAMMLDEDEATQIDGVDSPEQPACPGNGDAAADGAAGRGEEEQEEPDEQEEATQEIETPEEAEARVAMLPCSPENTFTRGTGPSARTRSTWYLIQTLLQEPVQDANTLVQLIDAANRGRSYDLRGLRYFLNHQLPREDYQRFFRSTLPRMQALALELPHLCGNELPVLRAGSSDEVTLTQRQIACLLVHAFFCLFPDTGRDALPYINFAKLYRGGNSAQMYAKLRCLTHYFGRVTEAMPQGKVTFRRLLVSTSRGNDVFASSDAVLTDAVIQETGTIEDDAPGLLHADFANKVLGGGVLGHGCVQEEILFVLYPELLASRIITQVLRDNEAVWVRGAERYANYTGYASSFRFAGNHRDAQPLDEQGRRITTFLAVDAIPFARPSSQFRVRAVRREAYKLLAALNPQPEEVHLPEPTAFATGNWGCGAFRGDRELKFLIQWLVASITGRRILYFTFGDPGLTDSAIELVDLLRQRRTRVSQLWQAVVALCDAHKQARAQQQDGLETDPMLDSAFHFVTSWLVR